MDGKGQPNNGSKLKGKKNKPRKLSISDQTNAEISELLDGAAGKTCHLETHLEEPELEPMLSNEQDNGTVKEDKKRVPKMFRFGKSSLGSNDEKRDQAETERLISLNTFDRTAHELFVELEELTLCPDLTMVWQEKARWIKFEEDIEEGAERWGEPHVASLSFHSLLALRKSVEEGCILFDLEASSLSSVSETVATSLKEMGYLSSNCLDRFTSSLLYSHRHVGDKNYATKPPDNRRTQLRRRSSPGVMLVNTDRKMSSASDVNKGSFRRMTSPEIDSHGVKTDMSMKDAIRDLESHIPSKIQEDETNENTPQPDVAELASRRKSVAVEFIQNLAQRTSAPQNPIMKRIPEGSEGAVVLVGSVDFIHKPVMAFVRLSQGQLFDNLMEVPVPVRFVCMILGPRHSTINYYEVGRSISTLLTNLLFRDIAYRADDRQDLLDAINEYLSASIVLPPGELEKKTLLPIMHKRMMTPSKPKALHRQTEKSESPNKFGDPLERTRRLFGGLRNDVRRRYPKYLSDFKDALSLQCLATFFFIYFACLSPAITFGGLLGDATGQLIGVSEMLVVTCVGGVTMALLAGQPLLIVGFTGPILIFEVALVQICSAVGLEFLSFRVWIGFWVTIIGTLFVMFEGSFLVRYVTRFVEEIFSSLISLIFIYEVFHKLYFIFERHPLLPYYPECSLNLNNISNISIETLETFLNHETTSEMLYYEDDDSNTTSSPIGVANNNSKPSLKPNTALLCLILTLGTFTIAYALKSFRNGKILGRNARRAIGDFGIPIAIFVMVLVDFLVKDTYTEKLDVPKSAFSPTAPSKRRWLIPPLGQQRPLPVWAIFLALLPALLVSILIFMETLISSVIVNKSERNLKKGSGYHLDIFIIGLLASFSGLFGLPMLCVATIRSVTHVSALSVYSRTHAPGEKPRLVCVLEQRLTGLLVHIMIGVSVLLGPVLCYVPLAVLFGVFLYMGVASMSGVQLFQRIKYLFVPVKHHSHANFVRRVRTWKMHLYTFIQLLCLAVLWVVKSTQAALAFPFLLITLVPVRLKLLPYFFSPKELFHLDNSEADHHDNEEPDFYDQARIST